MGKWLPMKERYRTYGSPGFPLDFFPVLFAVPRVVGWLAHWRQVCCIGSSWALYCSDVLTRR